MQANAGARPNIVFIFTDQQSASMMSCAGNGHLSTPAMDRLASEGVRFDRAYCTNPVCVPSRFSLMTGRMPGEIALRSNSADHIRAVPDEIKRSGLGWLLRGAGYDVAYGGKVHLPKLTPADIGFDYITRDERDGLAEACAAYISQERDKPFFLVASFINPHDVCYMAILDSADAARKEWLAQKVATETQTLEQALRPPEGMGAEEFFELRCPPLPANFEPQEDEPEAVRMLLSERPFRKNARENYSDQRWRMHRWAYCRLTEMVDRQIAAVCDAVCESGKEANTLVIFTSDHGDMDASHRMEHKSVFYEEASRVPLIVRQGGAAPAGTVDDTHLISNGLDLLPTLCDYAGVDAPDGLAGRSLRPLADGRKPESWPTVLPLESQTGRMIVTRRYKYMLHDKGESREQLIDLQQDPGEMRNAAEDSGNENILAQHRRMFEEAFAGGPTRPADRQ